MPSDTAKLDLMNLTLDELSDFIKQRGEPKFRARQIFSWLYRPAIRSFEQMTDLSLAFREGLAQISRISRLELAAREKSADGTIKYSFALQDGQKIESVLIPEEDRNTLCVSSQAGCAMGCTFCLTGTMGLKRNLNPAEIVNQVIYVRDELAEQGHGRVNNLVFMGMGEPLANFDNLVKALELLTDPRGMDFSHRRITVSTCGLAPKIKELGNHAKVNLAISLHAADDETRSRLMPVNDTYKIADLLLACRDFPLPSRRRIMIEYILIKDVNDAVQDARRLIKILHGLPCKINLLPYNETAALPFQRPARPVIENFQDTLRAAGYTVLIRDSRGSDISAACGQLANKVEK